MRKQKSSQSRSYKLGSQRRERIKSQATRSANLSEGSRQRRTQRHQYKRGSLRAGLAVLSGRAVGALSRRLHLGGGTSIAGVVAQRLYPDIVEHLAAQLEHGSIIVSGTNGKTTTCGFISAIMSDAGIRVWRNREGSNLMRGVASSLVIRALPNGQLRRSGKAISVFEIDEAVLPQITQIIAPRVLVLTNLFRDQLDRYGEVDSVIAYWKQAISNLPTETTLVLNADDPSVAALGESYAGKVLYYGIEDISLDISTNTQNNKRHQVIDTRTCPRCGSDYEYDIRFYSHMGHYHCPNGDTQRPSPDVRALQVQVDDFDRLRTIIELDDTQQEVIVPLPGLYNVYNALAAATAAHALSIGWGPIVSGIEQSKPAFGRGERIQADGRTIRLLLAKNPTGFNEVLRTLFSDGSARHILFVLNDNIADGRDISWIWDVDFERARGLMSSLVIAGTRALDLALRLKLAGIPQDEMLILPPAPLRATQRDDGSRRLRRANVPSKVHKSEATTAITAPSENYVSVARSYGLKKALDTALEKTPRGETLFIVPTYTGLLEVHHELEQRGLAAHYWEGETV